MKFILKSISGCRADEMRKAINDLFNAHKDDKTIRAIIERRIGYKYN